MGFRIEKKEYVNKNIRFEKSFLEELERLAQMSNVSCNAFIIECCKYAIQNMDSSEEEPSEK